MKLDEYLPEYDVRSRHSIEVNATPAEVFEALVAVSFTHIPLVQKLTRLRGFGRAPSALTMRQSLRRGGFIELCTSPPEEIVFGIVGQFWRPSGGRRTMESPQQFAAFAEPGHAKAAWNFLLTSLSLSVTELRTETRVRTFGRGALLKFRMYWFVVEPFSGILRRAILRDVKHRAEQARQSDY